MDGCEPHHLGQVCPLKGDLEVLGPSVLEAHLALGLSPRVDLNASPIPVSAREGGPSEDWAPLKAFSGRENLGLVTLGEARLPLGSCSLEAQWSGDPVVEFLENGLQEVGQVCLGQQVLSSEGVLKGERDPLACSVAEGGLNDGKRAAPTPLSSACHLLLTDEALMEEVTRFPVESVSNNLSFPVCPLGGGSSSSTSSMSLDEDISSRRIDSLIPCRKQDVGLLAEDKGNVYRPLCIISDKGLVVEALENNPKVAKITTLEASGEERASEEKSLSNLSYQKFISFSKFMGMSMDGNEKEIASLLRKMETKKQYRAQVAKRRPPSTPHLVRELQNLECSINYSKSNKKKRERSNGWELVCK